jgi:hypothetical protein
MYALLGLLFMLLVLREVGIGPEGEHAGIALAEVAP